MLPQKYPSSDSEIPALAISPSIYEHHSGMEAKIGKGSRTKIKHLKQAQLQGIGTIG
jgi:hypothetical protein